MTRWGRFALALMVATLAAGGAAHAQRGIDAHRIRPALDSFGIFTVERAETSRAFDFGFKVWFDYADKPLRLDLYSPSLNRLVAAPLLERQSALHLGLHFGLTSWLELVVDAPVSAQSYTSAYGTNASSASPAWLTPTGFYAADPRTNVSAPNAGPLDLAVGLKARLFRKGLFGMALSAVATLPFGDETAFLGDTNFTGRFQAIGDITRGPFTCALNVGVIVRETTRVYDPNDVASGAASPRLLMDLGHELTIGGGAAYRVVRLIGVAAELQAQVPVVGQTRDTTGDVLAGVQLFPARDLVISLGAGAGFLQSAHRTDTFHVFAGVSWAPAEGRASGMAGGFDTDGDGIPDALDQCPNEPEDQDGFDDEDGCPDPDNDQDGIPDARDRCPNEPEDQDGFEDEDGCPDPDNDQDGIPDAQDQCPNEPEDKDGFQDEDGCPDPDNDQDGIPDARDRCPNEPETRNGIDDEDGCPDAMPVALATEQLALPEPLQFEAGKATLTPRSLALLGRVAAQLKSNPLPKRIRVEAHEDGARGKKKAKALSQARAEAVRLELVKRGVAPSRLQAVGYGAARPLAKGSSAASRARNQRVELIIVE